MQAITQQEVKRYKAEIKKLIDLLDDEEIVYLGALIMCLNERASKVQLKGH